MTPGKTGRLSLKRKRSTTTEITNYFHHSDVVGQQHGKQGRNGECLADKEQDKEQGVSDDVGEHKVQQSHHRVN